MFVCYFVNNTSAVFNVKNTSAVCCKVSVWKSPRVIAGCVETCLFCVFRQLALVYVAGKSTMFRGKPNPGKHTEVFCEMKLCALLPFQTCLSFFESASHPLNHQGQADLGRNVSEITKQFTGILFPHVHHFSLPAFTFSSIEVLFKKVIESESLPWRQQTVPVLKV